jgi:hypothetical protein
VGIRLWIGRMGLQVKTPCRFGLSILALLLQGKCRLSLGIGATRSLTQTPDSRRNKRETEH